MRWLSPSPGAVLEPVRPRALGLVWRSGIYLYRNVLRGPVEKSSASGDDDWAARAGGEPFISIPSRLAREHREPITPATDKSIVSRKLIIVQVLRAGSEATERKIQEH